MLGWSYLRTSRVLHKLNTETHGLLLRNVGSSGRNARWTVTLVALRQAAPEWFGALVDGSRVEALEERVATLEQQHNMSATTIGDIVQRLNRARVA